MIINQIRSRACLFALVLLQSLSISSKLSAQSSATLVKGVVQNINNQPLPGVTVIIRNTKNNYTSGTSTDSSGGFTFTRITAGGPYSFTFSTVGYETQTLGGYNIKGDITLSV